MELISIGCIERKVPDFRNRKTSVEYLDDGMGSNENFPFHWARVLQFLLRKRNALLSI